jgi:hypothetical protein
MNLNQLKLYTEYLRLKSIKPIDGYYHLPAFIPRDNYLKTGGYYPDLPENKIGPEADIDFETFLLRKGIDYQDFLSGDIYI